MYTILELLKAGNVKQFPIEETIRTYRTKDICITMLKLAFYLTGGIFSANMAKAIMFFKHEELERFRTGDNGIEHYQAQDFRISRGIETSLTPYESAVIATAKALAIMVLFKDEYDLGNHTITAPLNRAYLAMEDAINTRHLGNVVKQKAYELGDYLLSDIPKQTTSVGPGS